MCRGSLDFLSAPRKAAISRINSAFNILSLFSGRKQRARQLLPYADLAVMTVGAMSDNATTPCPPLLLTVPVPPTPPPPHLQFDLLFYCLSLPRFFCVTLLHLWCAKTHPWLLFPAGLSAHEQTNGKPGH